MDEPPYQPSYQTPPSPRSRILARQISSSVLAIISLVLLVFSLGGGYLYYHFIFDEPMTDQLQFPFRLAAFGIGAIILAIIGIVGLCCGTIACIVRPWGAR